MESVTIVTLKGNFECLLNIIRYYDMCQINVISLTVVCGITVIDNICIIVTLLIIGQRAMTIKHNTPTQTI